MCSEWLAMTCAELPKVLDSPSADGWRTGAGLRMHDDALFFGGSPLFDAVLRTTAALPGEMLSFLCFAKVCSWTSSCERLRPCRDVLLVRNCTDAVLRMCGDADLCLQRKEGRLWSS